MRIITGDFKGRRLEMPVGNDIRPTTEKVKEALFSMIAGNLYDAVCADLLAGPVIWVWRRCHAAPRSATSQITAEPVWN